MTPVRSGAMRVLHVSQPVEAGVAKVVAGLLRDQRARGWEVAVACPSQGWLPETAMSGGVEVIPWTASRSPGPSVPSETRTLARVVAAVNPHVVHLHSAKAGLAGRLAIRGNRLTVFQPHAWSFEAVTGALHIASRWWERVAQQWTDLTVCVSDAELQRGREAGIRGSAVVVPNGVDPAAWGPCDRAASRRALDVPQDVPLVLCVGRLTRQKGQDLLLQAWAHVRRAAPSARLVLIGTGPDLGLLSSLSDSSVRLASDTHLAHWYAAADVVAVPSRWEAGLPLVAMEAMVSRRSVVAFDVAGIGSCLQGAGVAVPPLDVGAFAAALTSRLLAPGLAAREGEHGRALTTSRFTAARSYSRVAGHILSLTKAAKIAPLQSGSHVDASGVDGNLNRVVEPVTPPALPAEGDRHLNSVIESAALSAPAAEGGYRLTPPRPKSKHGGLPLSELTRVHAGAFVHQPGEQIERLKQ